MANAQLAAQKWQRNLGAAGESIKAGVESLKENPLEQAAQSESYWKQKVMEAADKGSFAKGLRAVSFADWKQAMLTKGISRLTSGATAAAPKVAKFLAEYLPVAESISQEVKAMPKGGTEESLARVRVAIERSKQFAESRRR